MNSAASRGAIITLVAVALGIFILGRGLDTPSIEATAPDAATPTAQPEDDGGGDGSDGGDDAADSTDGTDEVADDGTDEGTDAADAGAADDGPEVVEEETGATPRPPSDVAVLVANGSGVQGAATRFTSDLTANNYTAFSPVNASPQDQSRIFYEEGYEADAVAIARLVSAPPGSISPMVEPPPGGVELRGANILILLGADELPNAGGG